ncbi:MAG: aquaporin family protein [Gammaproteobacteria bacterium]|nr:aquaporin family protein [Gammaproteobacteria bacterium]MDG0997687.1 aquaporin family protein [Gammaproteobacteria bacterium]
MDAYIAELLGTFILILIGAGVNANVSLAKTGGNDSGYIIITAGWGIAVFVAVFVTGDVSGAHINPAVTIGLASAGEFAWSQVPGYILAQLIGAFFGAVAAWFQYKDHFDITDNPSAQLGVFSTAPVIPNVLNNLYSEVLATFVLVLGVLYIASPEVGLGALDALPVGLLVFGIGMAMGGTTGYAINPARDLGPRIAHAVLPIYGKGSSNWNYAWIPVVGPIIGSILAAILYNLLPF